MVAGVEQSRRKLWKLWKTVTFSLENFYMDTEAQRSFPFATVEAALISLPGGMLRHAYAYNGMALQHLQ